MRFILAFFSLLTLVSAGTEIRVATYNTSLAQTTRGRLAAQLRQTTFDPAQDIAEVIQLIAPDILLLNEFDYDPGSTALTRFNNNYLNRSQNGRPAQNYPYRYTAPSNTGIHSGFDLDNNGEIDSTPNDQGYGGDAFGFGEFEGKYGMALLSKYPIDVDAIRTFQLFQWQDMPGNLIPNTFYTNEEKTALRLSSKSHWDIPVIVEGQRIHLLCSHPTPPVFDGPEDRNGRRNHDEIRLWADYLSADNSSYLVDDNGLSGGLRENNRFLLLGDQNADPTRGDSFQSAINQWLNHPRIDSSFTPMRPGTSTAISQTNTATFGLRVDYLLPSKEGFNIINGAVFWPTGSSAGANQVTASDHRPVYLDLEIIPTISEAVRNLQVTTAADTATLKWSALSDANYIVESSVDLDRWEELEYDPSINNGIATVAFPMTPSLRFLRVKVVTVK